MAMMVARKLPPLPLGMDPKDRVLLPERWNAHLSEHEYMKEQSKMDQMRWRWIQKQKQKERQHERTGSPVC